MAIIIAAIFIGIYFYRSANNIQKSGPLWVGIALGTFLALSFIGGLVIYSIGVNFLNYSSENGSLLGTYLGLVVGILGLFIVNYYMNIIPD